MPEAWAQTAATAAIEADDEENGLLAIFSRREKDVERVPGGSSPPSMPKRPQDQPRSPPRLCGCAAATLVGYVECVFLFSAAIVGSMAASIAQAALVSALAFSAEACAALLGGGAGGAAAAAAAAAAALPAPRELRSLLAALLAPLRTLWLLCLAVRQVAAALRLAPRELLCRVGLCGPRAAAPFARSTLCLALAYAATAAALLEEPFATGPLLLRWDGARLAEAVLLAPLKEELLFRGLVWAVLHNRMETARPRVTAHAAAAVGDAAVAPRSGSSSAGAVRAAWHASGLFAVAHAANALGTGGLGLGYVAAQVALAFAVGLYLSLRLLRGGSLWECLALHIVTNGIAALFPRGEVAGGAAGVAATLCVYAALNACMLRALAAADSRRHGRGGGAAAQGEKKDA
jgi:membrane protease YdiL (CAAX protease family)